MDPIQTISRQLDLNTKQVGAAVELIEEGNTIPFIARYRKEVTGELDEEQLRAIEVLLESLRALEKRRQTILKTISELGKLTPELELALSRADTLARLEDLYQPYKPKRRTRASEAREKGLQPLAELMLNQPRKSPLPEEAAAGYLSENVPSVKDALGGARDIVAETISEFAEIRGRLRQKALKWATLHSQGIEGSEDPKNVYALYADFELRVDKLRPHQVLAINRGESEKVLRVSVETAERDWRDAIARSIKPDPRSPFARQLEMAIEDAAKRLLLPAIERDVRRALTETAEEHAVKVFATNLRNLLLQPPLTGHVVLGIDPGYRTGCKCAVVEPTGRVVATATIYPHSGKRQRQEAQNRLAALLKDWRVSLIAIGNGTASRETEALAAELIQSGEVNGVEYLIVNEAGASVYSASPLARAELPSLDVTLRGAVSIARRVQDPLAELVKIDPRSIGIGLYQHDLNHKSLSETLNGVVESVVNLVGVDTNTASPALLSYVAGIGPSLADKIVAHRQAAGSFTSRMQLMDVPGLGARTFQQAAGFLRIRDGTNPLDSSAIHPESYALAGAVLAKIGLSPDASQEDRQSMLAPWQEKDAVRRMADELRAGIPTLTDILEQLIRPGRDPRESIPLPILRSDVLSIDDLHIGMSLKGTVRNVVDFGAFVDIGVKQDGLLHRSQWPKPAELGVGDVIEVTILRVEADRGRISLGWSN